MDAMVQRIKISKFIGIYVVSFLFALQVALPVYVNSSFLAELVGTDQVGLTYAVASLLTIFAFFIITPLLRRFGNYRVGLSLLIILFFSLLTLALAEGAILLIAMALILFAGVVLVRFSLDIILETYSSDIITGDIRGEFGTIWNIPWIIAPLIAGVLAADGDFGRVYLAAALVLVPTIFIFARTFKTFPDPEYRRIPFANLIREVLASRDLASIFAVGFLLQFFFSWMVIYAPIYLHESIGFSWPQIGILLAVALVPYIIFQWPLGRIADTKMGEKELLSLGFVILALSTAMMSFITVAHMAIWMILLFLTRTGASMVEIMSETYFFKKIDGKNVNLMGFYRTLRPLAYVASPVVASLFLIAMDVRYLFVVLGAIMLGALFYSNAITDTL